MQTRDATNPMSFDESEGLRRLHREIRAIAPLDSNVLLGGETGTGKGRTARLIHEHSRRASSPFVHVDCAALSGGLIESELFGHERGAFTGATQQHIGRFERAGCGTIFLDEIGDLAQELQAKLPGTWRRSCRPSSCACSKTASTSAWAACRHCACAHG